MTKIGVLSDTHAYLNPKLFTFFESCNELWHAGDIGNLNIAKELADFKPLKAVHGNIDDTETRNIYPAHQRFCIDNTTIWITHIGGYPGKYYKGIEEEIKNSPPDIFICGHSHILKVIYDKKLKLMHINPGAAGKFGLHQICTAIRFDLEERTPKNLEILEFLKNSG